MCVPVWVDHELDPTFDSLLLALANMIENVSDNCIDLSFTVFVLFSNGYYSIDQSVLHFSVVCIDGLLLRMEYWLVSSLDHDCVNDPLYERHIRVHYLRLLELCGSCRSSSDFELLLGLSEHLLLFLGDSGLLSFFLASDFFLLLTDLMPPAFTASTLALSRPEIVLAGMTTAAFDLNCDGLRRNCHDTYLASMLVCLAAESLHNLDTVVADLMLSICELPESNLASMAWLLQLPPLLLVTPLLDRMSESCFTSFNSWASRVCVLIFSSGLSAGSFMLAGLSYGCNFRLVRLLTTASLLSDASQIRDIDRTIMVVIGVISCDLDTDVSEECVNCLSVRCLLLLMLLLRMRSSMSMMMLMVMGMMMGVLLRRTWTSGSISAIIRTTVFSAVVGACDSEVRSDSLLTLETLSNNVWSALGLALLSWCVCAACLMRGTVMLVGCLSERSLLLLHLSDRESLSDSLVLELLLHFCLCF